VCESEFFGVTIIDEILRIVSALRGRFIYPKANKKSVTYGLTVPPKINLHFRIVDYAVLARFQHHLVFPHVHVVNTDMVE
jgi:hypothetical protein